MHKKIESYIFSAVQDRTIYEDIIFAKMLYKNGKISRLDFSTYKELHYKFVELLKFPDTIIYINVTPREALRRIKRRGRDCEKNITIEYLKGLKEGYNSWIKKISKSVNVIEISENYKIEDVIESIKNIEKI